MRRAGKTVFLPLALLLAVPVFSRAQPAKTSEEASVRIFFEAMDSQGWQLFFLGDALKRRLPRLNVDIYPLMHKSEKGEWITPRGDIEVKESGRMMAIKKKYPGKLLSYLTAKSLSPWPEGWYDAAIYSDINPAELAKYEGSNREKLLQEAFAAAGKMKVEKNSLFINGKIYEGEARLMPLLEAVNAVLPAGKKMNLYKEQQALVKAPGFKVISSPAAKDFADANVIGVFKRYFTNLKPEDLDYTSEAVKKEFPGLKFLPAYAIEDTPSVRENMAQAIAAGALEKSGSYYIFYNKNGKLLINGLKEEPKKLELFVMSQCPYGVVAENSVIDAANKNLIAKDIKIEIHYIAESSRDGKGTLSFRSLHGEPEWKENARQLLIKKNYPGKFFAYLSERNKTYQSPEWESAAVKAGLDPGKIEAEAEKGKRLLEEDVKRANSLEIGSSPTFLVNGNILVVGIGQLMQMDDYKKLGVQAAPAGACN
ncbi:MAG: hypothetical protein COT17_06095 [Elusimicrobia bacterium CG08_land_8_20_14_0_20_51_18]|nr:MAG: hypothetical protein COT17_06095 [Elusimicrobia bacterium CG08_land_8_20_14_0_20_51_18]